MTGPSLTPADTQQGYTDAEWNDVATQLHDQYVREQAKKKLATPPSSSLSGIGHRLSDFFASVMPDKNTPRKYGQAIVRGVADAGSEAGNTLNEISTSVGALRRKKNSFIPDWMTAPIFGSNTGDKVMSDAEVDARIGQRQEGAAGFITNATQFATGFALAGEALKPLEFLSKVPTLARAVAGGLSDMTVFDPYKARLSNMVQDGPTWLRNPLTQFLAADHNDNAAEARLKSGLEGMMTGYAIDKFVAGVKVLRAIGRDATPEEVKTALNSAHDIKYEPNIHGPVKVTPEEDGTFTLENTQEAVPPTIDRRKPDASVLERKPTIGEMEFHIRRRDMSFDQFVNTYPHFRDYVTADEYAQVKSEMLSRGDTYSPLPKFNDAVTADANAASMNQAYLNAKQPVAELTADQVNQVKSVATSIAEQPRTLAEANALLDGTDFNFNYTASPDEAKSVIEAISRQLPEATTGMRNTGASGLGQTHAETVKLADDLLAGLDGEQAVNAIRKAFDNTVDLPQMQTAARIYLHGLGRKVAQLGRVADADPENAVAFNELKTAMEHLWDIHANLAGTISNTARTLDANKIIVGPDGAMLAAAKSVASAVAEDAPLAKLSKSELLALARQITMADGDPNQILDAMRASQRLAEVARPSPTLMDRVNNFRMQSMLSGPKTQIVNALNNAIVAFQMPTELWWGGLTSGRTALREQGADQLTGLFMESREAFRAAAKAFRTGANYLDESGSLVSDSGLNASNPMSGLVKLANLPSRMLMTSDEFFKNLSYRSSVRAQSLRLAREQGITDPTELATRVADDMRAAFALDGSATNPIALQFARTATFQNPLEAGTYAGDFQRFVQDHPAMRLVVPFVRTPVNLFKYAWQRTPLLNRFTQEWKADIAAGGDRAAVARAKTQMGMMMYSGAAMLAYQHLITGSGPKNSALRAQWLAAGNQPYSVKVPGVGWMSYRRGDPTFTPLGLVADFVSVFGELHAHTTEETAAAIMASIASNVTSKTFMQGMTETLDAISSGDGFRMKKLLTNTAASFLPNFLRQVNPDGTLRETRTMLDELMARVPGFSTELEPRRNIFGEPIMKPPGYGNQAINPFTVMADPGDHDVQNELVKLGKAMALPSEMSGNVALTDRISYDNGTGQSPYDRMLELVSKSHDGEPNLRTAITKLVKSEEWHQLSDGTETYPGGRKFQMASMIISKYQDRAFRQVLEEYPKLKTALHLDKVNKRAALRNGSEDSRPQFLSQ